MDVETLRDRLRALETAATLDRAALDAYLGAAIRSLEVVERESDALREEFVREAARWRGDELISVPHPLPEHEILRWVTMWAAIAATAGAAGLEAWAVASAFGLSWYFGVGGAAVTTVSLAGVFCATSSDPIRRRALAQRCATLGGAVFATCTASLLFIRLSPTSTSPLWPSLVTAIGAVAINVMGGALLSLSSAYGWSRDMYRRYVRRRAKTEALQAIIADAQALFSAERRQASIVRLPVAGGNDAEQTGAARLHLTTTADEPLLDADANMSFLALDATVLRSYFRACVLAAGASGIGVLITALLTAPPLAISAVVFVLVVTSFLGLRAFFMWKSQLAQIAAFRTEIHELRTRLRRAPEAMFELPANGIVG